MGKGLAVSLVVGLGLGFGCGGDGDDLAVDASGDIDAPAGTADATPAPDTPTPDAGPLMTDQCPATYGPASVSMTFEIATGDMGFDLNGDDEIDNVIGGSDFVRSSINSNFSSSLDSGSLRTLTELRDFGGLGPDDSDLTMVLYGGVDSDVPRETSDDFTGDEDYYFRHDWVFSLTCEPRAAVAATYTGGVVDVAETDLTFFVDSLGGFLEIKKARIRATIEADTAGFKSVDGTPVMLGGAITACSLSKGETPLGNALHVLVQTAMISPDIDIDGDGLEVIVTQSLVIERCIDGDGTLIEGEDCACDPRIKDGFSVTFLTDQVGAAILGPDPNP